jgi:hypothetical protein
MKKENPIRIFERKQVRTFWDEEKELWYISVIDVIEVPDRNRPSRKVLE